MFQNKLSLILLKLIFVLKTSLFESLPFDVMNLPGLCLGVERISPKLKGFFLVAFWNLSVQLNSLAKFYQRPVTFG